MATLIQEKDETSNAESLTKKQKILTRVLAIANTGGQNFYFNYATILAVGIGATALMMAFITAIQNLGSALFQTFFGKMSDKIGRKLVLITGFVIASISTAVIAFLSSPIIFMVVIAIYSLGISMVIPTWNALLGDISTEKTRTKIISQISMIGSFFSSMILLLLGFLTDFLPFDILKKYRVMILIGALFFAMAAILSILISETNANKKNRKKSSFWEPMKDRKFLKFTGITMTWWFVMSFLWPLSPIVNASVNPTNTQLAIMSVVFAVFIAFGQWICGFFADKIGRRFTLVLGFISFSLVPVILAYSYTWTIILVANVFGGLGNGFLTVTLSSEILHLSKEETKGAYSGTYNLMTGIVSFFGAFVGGFLYDGFLNAYNSAFALKISLLIIAAIRFIAILPTLFLSINEKKKLDESGVEKVKLIDKKQPL
ncbi:MAG: MFS transporter [Candidatus Heimdallarchaeota archaeon]|nr:MFS transporter [Candidatus Heimdallarchaeota archaeon]